MSPNAAEADLLRARDEGRRAGAIEARSAIDCPYAHSVLPLRTAWLEGFGEGRLSVEPIPIRGRNHDPGLTPHTA